MVQCARLNHVKETRLVNDATIGVDDNPVVAKELPDGFRIILDNRFREFFFER